MAADGKITIDVDLNDKNAKKGIDGLDDGAKKASGSFSSLGKVIGAIGAVVIGAKAISSLKDFTVESVKAAATAQALNSQFSQVFGNLERDATAALQGIADETNILPERLKGSFTQIAAFAKTAGFDNAQALELSSRATLAAADSAAFYDRSIESVTETLQSYLKGNYANDAALGISSTETTRNAAANELYGKSFDKLSEAQKQLTLLKQVEDSNALTGALGQAAREGTQFENVTGNLAQAWENFKVAIGGNFLDLAVSGIVALTNAIQSINLEAINTALGVIVSAITNIATATIPLLIQAFEFVKSAISTLIEFVAPIVEGLRDLWQSNTEQISSAVSNAFNTVRDVITNAVQAVLDFVEPQLENLRKFWQENGEQILQAVTNAFNGILAVIDFVMPAIRLIIDIVWGAIQDIISGALSVITGLVKVFSGVFTGDFSKIWEGIKDIFTGAIDFILGVMTLSFFGGIRAILVNLSKSGLTIIKGLWDDALNLFRNFVDNSVGAISGLVSRIIGFFSNLVKNVLQFIRQWRTDSFKLLDDIVEGMVQKFIALPGKFLQIGKDIIAALINGIKSLNPIKVIGDIADGIVNGFKAVFGGGKVMAAGEEIPTELAKGVKKAAPIALKANHDFRDEYVKITEDAVVQEKKSSLDSIKGLEETEKKKKATKTKANKDTKSADEIYLDQLSDRIKKEREYGNISVLDEAKMWQDSLGVLTKGSDQYLQARTNYNNAVIEAFEQKKKSGELSLQDEADFWKGQLDVFKVGSDQYVEAQRNYKDALAKIEEDSAKRLKDINDKVIKTNEDYQKKVNEINTNLLKQEEDLTKAYEKAYDDRYKALYNFSGLFDEFKVDTDVTGKGLLQNLETQVSGFQNWQENIDRLSRRAIDDGLLAELRKLGPSALAEIQALNSLTDAELTRYSDLFYIKSHNARLQTENELYQLKVNTGQEIAQLRSIALVQLDELEKEWIKDIQNIVRGTEQGFSSMEDIGRNAAQNLYNGIASVESSLIAKATSIASSVQAAFANALNVPGINGPSFGGLTAPSSVQSSASSSGASSSSNKTQINNITVQSTNEATAMQREVRKLNFGF